MSASLFVSTVMWAIVAASDAGAAPVDEPVNDAGAASVDVGAPSMAPVDAVDAGSAGAAEPAPLAADAGVLVSEAPPAFPARVNEQPSPLVFRLARGTKDARTRAREASVAMEAALATGVADAPLVEIVANADLATVQVKGRAVATLTAADARAEGARELALYAAELETRLLAFVTAEERRHSAQAIALHFFVSIAIALLALLTLRALGSAFSRLEKNLEERRDVPTPLKLFGVPLLSGEALRGVTVILLFVGRILATLLVVIAALVFALSQFDTTRPWAGKIIGWALSPFVGGADALVRALPGLVLAAVLAVAAAAAVRLARLLLDDIGAGRVPSRLDKARVRPMRAIAAGAILLVFAPLIVSAAFSRFGTPLETLTLFAGGAVALAVVPLLASAAVGGAVLWRARVRLGDWVTIGAAEGEVSSVDLLDVTLVPGGGGTFVVPMIALAWLPVRRHARAPSAEVRVTVKRDRPLADIESALKRIARDVDPSADVQWVAIGAESADALLSVPLDRTSGPSALVRALAVATEKSELTLWPR